MLLDSRCFSNAVLAMQRWHNKAGSEFRESTVCKSNLRIALVVIEDVLPFPCIALT